MMARRIPGEPVVSAAGLLAVFFLPGISDRRFEDTDSAFLNDPEGALEGLGFQRAGEGGEKTMQDFLAHAGGATKDCYAVIF
jgi:hypothetical protein